MHLEHVSSVKDLCFVIDSELNTKEHIYGKITQSFSMLAIINRDFFNLDKDVFKLLYKSLVQSHIEFSHSVWNPDPSIVLLSNFCTMEYFNFMLSLADYKVDHYAG